MNSSTPVGHTSVDPTTTDADVCQDDSTIKICGVDEPYKFSKERFGWYIYEGANNGFGGIASTMFLPLFLVATATHHSFNGSPVKACSAIDDMQVTCTDTFCYMDGFPTRQFQGDCTACVPGEGTQLWNGLLGKFEDYETPTVPFFGFNVEPVSFTTITVALSVAFQAIAFISLGALADYGNFRFKGLIISSVLGQMLTLSYIFYWDSSLYWLSGLVFILTNVMFGIGTVFYNAYLPILVDAHPRLIKEDIPLRDPSLIAFRDRFQNLMSTNGFVIGYMCSIMCLFICIIIQVVCGSDEENSWLGDRLAIAFCGGWWVVFSFVTYYYLKVRPGPPLPEGQGVLKTAFLGWSSLISTLKDAKKYPITFRFLILYFFYSDTYSTIASVGVLFGQQELCCSSAELAGVLMVVLLSAVVGNKFYLYLKNLLGLDAKHMVIINLSCYLFLCVWGALGLFNSLSIGFKHKWELWAFAFIHGSNLGSINAFTRALFADFILPGRESEFFSLYAITDKGSSWLGPLIAGVMNQSTGSLRWVFVYLLVMCLWPIICLHLFIDHKKGLRDVGRVAGESGVELQGGRKEGGEGMEE